MLCHTACELVERALFAERRMTFSAAFLDRDGTINVKAPEGDYITRPERLRLLGGAADAIRQLNDAAIPVFVVTNQRGIALGRMTEGDLAAVHERLDAMLAEAGGARIDDYAHCPHERGACDCRKPGTACWSGPPSCMGSTSRAA